MQTIDKEKILEIFKFRQSIKKFDTTKKISPEDFNFLLEIARLSPTSFGFEPYKILVLENEELKKRILKDSWGGSTIAHASHTVFLLSQTKSLMTQEYLNNFMKEVQALPPERVEDRGRKFNQFITEDFKITDERGFVDWASKQTYIVATNMMIAAAMMGLDSCPIEGFNMERVEQTLANDYQIETDLYKPSLMITFGYRDEPQREKTRRDLKDIVMIK